VSDDELPLLTDIYPELITYLESALIAEGDESLARAVRQLRFHGWCTCRESCKYLKTAPDGVADSLWAELEDEESPTVWLQLSQGHTSFAGMEICDYALGPAPETDPLRPAHVA
jgi:hypothetical protein